MLTIIEDTRQKKGKYQEAHQYFKDRGVNILRSKLPYGDYGLLTNMSRVIDTKKGFEECAGNFASKDHDRVKREIVEAKAHGIELIFLVIDKKVNCLEDAKDWHNVHGKVRGETLYKILNAVQIRHGVRFEFCTPEQSGPKILELLGVQP